MERRPLARGEKEKEKRAHSECKVVFVQHVPMDAAAYDDEICKWVAVSCSLLSGEDVEKVKEETPE